MITDFPEAKRKLMKELNQLLRVQVRENSPISSGANVKILHEGNSMGILHADGEHKVSRMKEAASEFSVMQEDIPNISDDELMSKVDGVAKDMAGKMERGMLETMLEATESSGNVLTTNQTLNPSTLLDAMEMLSIDFEDDDREKPVKPTMVVHPEMMKCLQEKVEAATPEEKSAFSEREKEILDKKFQQHLADLDSRKLID